MDDMEEKINGILSDPDTMGKIMAIAQSLNKNEPPQQKASEPHPPLQAPEAPAPGREGPPMLQGLDLTMLKKLSSFSGQAAIDKNQRTLLRALSPYLSQQRLTKLEKAMQAAKMAQMASTMLSPSQSNPGR